MQRTASNSWPPGSRSLSRAPTDAVGFQPSPNSNSVKGIVAEADAVEKFDAALADLASAMLTLRRVGQLWTQAVAEQVGPDYVDNATIASLNALREHGPLRLRDLAEHLGLPNAPLSRVIDRLVALGDVERTPGPPGTDGRAVFMKVTTRGVRHDRAIEDALRNAAPESSILVEATLASLSAVVEYFGGESHWSPDRGADTALASAGARLGIRLSNVLRSIAPSGDIAEALALLSFIGNSPTRPSVISERVGLTSGGTTKVLDRLESAGLIERTYGTPDDRRGVSLELTDRGEAELRRILTDSGPHLPVMVPSTRSVLEQLARVEELHHVD